jgi:choline dehydrogenase
MQLQAPTYGVAEQAANIIRSFYNQTPKPGTVSTSTTTATATAGGPSSSTGSSSGSKSGSPSSTPRAAGATMLLLGVVALFSLL